MVKMTREPLVNLCIGAKPLRLMNDILIWGGGVGEGDAGVTNSFWGYLYILAITDH